MRHNLSLAALAAGSLIASHAIADGITAPDVAKVLQDKGYKAVVGVDSDGDPKVSSGAEGVNFTVFFYGCNHTQRCASLTFQAAFHIEGGLSSDKINGWNRDKRFLKGWLDKTNDPYCEMDVDAEHGVAAEALGSWIDNWVAGLPEFKTYVGF